jgi:exodeoxyribonuclease VII small subunit
VATRDEQPTDRYSDVVDRLEEVVKKLEGGQLSLEDSLEEFEKGIQLVKRGEALLQQADSASGSSLEHKGRGPDRPLEPTRGAVEARRGGYRR